MEGEKERERERKRETERDRERSRESRETLVLENVTKSTLKIYSHPSATSAT